MLARRLRRGGGADREVRATGDRRLDDDLLAEGRQRAVLGGAIGVPRDEHERHDRQPDRGELGEVALVDVPLDDGDGVDDRRDRSCRADPGEELRRALVVVPRRAQDDERRCGPVAWRVPHDQVRLEADVGERGDQQPGFAVGGRHVRARHEHDVGRGRALRQIGLLHALLPAASFAVPRQYAPLRPRGSVSRTREHVLAPSPGFPCSENVPNRRYTAAHEERDMISIAIVGTGISGLQLALTLQQAGVDTTLYAEKTADEMRAGRLPNTVVRFASTVARDRALGVGPWDSTIEAMHVSILDTPIAFCGRVADPASAVDFRVYLPALLEAYVGRGGRVAYGATSAGDVVARTAEHDLTVVASGRDSIGAFFPRDERRSPHMAPQRTLCAAFFRGIAPTEPHGAACRWRPASVRSSASRSSPGTTAR